MLKQISDMPAGALGFEVVGTFEDDDFEEFVERSCAGRSGRTAI